MTLKEILEHRNINDEVYASDIKRWLVGIDSKAVWELQELLSKINDTSSKRFRHK